MASVKYIVFKFRKFQLGKNGEKYPDFKNIANIGDFELPRGMSWMKHQGLAIHTYWNNPLWIIGFLDAPFIDDENTSIPSPSEEDVVRMYNAIFSLNRRKVRNKSVLSSLENRHVHGGQSESRFPKIQRWRLHVTNFRLQSLGNF